VEIATESASTDARVVPSGENASPVTSPACADVSWMRVRLWASQRVTVPALVAVANTSPEGLKATAVTAVPRLGRRSPVSPVKASHRKTRPSSPPLRIRLPSGEKSMSVTADACPHDSPAAAPVEARHSLMTLSRPALARTAPSGLKERAVTGAP